MENNIIKIYENKKEVIESAKCEIFGALEPSELIGSVFTLTKLKMSLKKAENQFKEFSKPYQDAIKSAKEDLDELENDIKTKFLETYKESEVVVPKRQFNAQTGKWETLKDENGNVLMKTKTTDNKGEKVFIYTPSKTKIDIDKSKITFETHPHLFKQIWVLDEEKLALEETLPTKTETTEEKVGIQWKVMETEITKLENKNGK